MRPLLLAVLVALVACAEPSIPQGIGVAPMTITTVTALPERDDGLVPRVVRLSITTEPTLDSLDAAYLVAGGADATEVAALAKNHLTTTLRARLVPITHWLERSLLVQPGQVLEGGRASLVLLPSKRAPLVLDLTIASDGPEIARPVWSTASTTTFCASSLPVELPDAMPLSRPTANVPVRRVPGVPCFDVLTTTQGQLLPPAFAGLALDPTPLPVETTAPSSAPCPAGSIAVDVLCVRVEDDRIVFYGDADARRVLLGRIAGRPLLERIAPGARLVVRGLASESTFSLDLVARDGGGDHRITRMLTTRRPRRHVVLNEMLVRPPSGASSQRFVELVNDGDTPVELAGLVLVDGTRRWKLPEGTLSPAGFALITPEGFVDGLGGEVAPPRGPLRITVERLTLSSGLTLVDTEGAVLSRFPPTTSTRTVARGRRTPDRPDDAPDAFGWDAAGRATPGRANSIGAP